MIKIILAGILTIVIDLFKRLFGKKEEDIYIENEIIDEAAINPLSPITATEPKSDIQPKEGSIEQLIEQIAKEYGVDPVLACLVAKCESGLNPKAVNEKGNYPSTSRDRGLFQINSYWHKGISDEQAFNPEFATRFFCQAVKNGKLNWWSSSQHCWNKDHKYYD